MFVYELSGCGFESRCRKCADALNKIGLDSKKFGLHCLRSGGATAAANLGVGDRLVSKA